MDNFAEYMWYLLITPLKRVAKAQNHWHAFCRVFGRRFDEVKEDLFRARDEGMVDACCNEMLPVHGADRGLTRYDGEEWDNFRSRIAMHEEICKLGGTNEGILTAVKALGYGSPMIVRANDLTGFVHFTLDGSWRLDGSRRLNSDAVEDRWAEFYLIIAMEADEKHPISFGILQKTVRMWKEVGAKDNYFFQYWLSVREINSLALRAVSYKKLLSYYGFLKMDGSHTGCWKAGWEAVFKSQHAEENSLKQMYWMQSCREAYSIRAALQYRISIVQLKHNGFGKQEEYMARPEFHYCARHTRKYKVTCHEQHNLFCLDGTWKLDGSKRMDAWQKEEVV